jgi:predicted Rossmann-fold nucleotide-binding protein
LQLGLHTKPCGLINVNGFFDPLFAFLDNAVENGFMKREHREMLLVAQKPEQLLTQLENCTARSVDKWVGVRIRS